MPRMIGGLVLFIAAIFMQTLPFNADLQKVELVKLFDLNIPVIIGTVGLILLLWGVIESFYTGPLWKIINERNTSIEATFTEAETLRAEMKSMKADYEKRIQETEASAREQIQAQVREAQELRKTLMAEASAKADEMVRKAQEDIAAEKARALADIRVQVASLSLAATEKLLVENMNTERNQRLIDEFLSKAEVRN